MNEKEMFLNVRKRELPIFLRVLKAFPKDQGAFKPHERSRSASELAFTLAAEQSMSLQELVTGKIGGAEMPPVPENFDDIIAAFEKSYEEVTEKIKNSSEEELNKEIDFFGNHMRAMDFLWLLFNDGIHHRGQFSVYIRMAGGKVPSIYGPSGDDSGTV